MNGLLIATSGHMNGFPKVARAATFTLISSLSFQRLSDTRVRLLADSLLLLQRLSESDKQLENFNKKCLVKFDNFEGKPGKFKYENHKWLQCHTTQKLRNY
jgi:hypothetical protein